MSDTERTRPAERPTATAPNAGPDGSGRMAELRRTGRDMLSAAERAIDRALSHDSERFLASSEQEGGE